jgi:hypothetical protein
MSTKTNSRSSLLITAALVFVPLLTLSIVGGYLAREEIRHQTLSNLETFASAQEARVEQLINVEHTIHNGIATRTQFRALLENFNATGSSEDAAGINKILLDAKEPFSDVKGMALLSTNSSLVTELGDTKIPADLHQRFFERGSKTFYIQPVSLDGKLVILHAGPVKRGDNTIGVLVMAFSSDGLRAITHSADGLGETGETVIGYLNDKKDEAILLPTRLQKTSDPVTIPREDNLPIIPTLIKKQDRTYEAALDYRGKKIIAATRYLEGADWAVVTKKDQGEVFANLSTFIAIYIFAVVVILIVTFGGLILL